MKKLLLLTTVLCIFSLGFSQKRAPVSKAFKDVKLTRHYQVPTDLAPPMTNWNVPSNSLEKSALLLGDETEIAETVYDLQSNASLSNRIYAWEDGTVAAVCTRGIQQPAVTGGFPDRGTGYNYFDGVSWAPKPSARLESVRAGWPSIAPLGENGEIVVSHNFGVKLILLTRPNKGTGAWTETYYNGPGGGVIPSWPRVVASGENNEYTQLIYCTNGAYQGQSNTFLYSRSSDGGQSWNIQDQLIDGVGSDYYVAITADDYVMASRGNTVAILCASAWYDLFMLKSSDNGETWEKTVIWEHPIPLFDIQTQILEDTLFAPGNSAEVAIDNNGMCHVVYAVTRVMRDATMEPGYYSWFPYYDGIGYWNENMEAPIPEPDDPPSWTPDPAYWTLNPDYLYEEGQLIGYAQDVNGDGQIAFEGTASSPDFPFANYRELGLSTMPTLTIDGNNIMVAFSSVTETYITTDGLRNYRHIWVINSTDLGNTWFDYFYDLQAGNIFHIYDECIYPQLAPSHIYSVSDSRNLLYQADNMPGVYLDEDEQTEPSTNRLIHSAVPLIIGIEEEPGTTKNAFNVYDSYPNPTKGLTQIRVELKQPMNVSVEITNLTGQIMMEIPAKALQAGSHNLTIDASSLGSGVYFYTVSAGNESITKKLIVE